MLPPLRGALDTVAVAEALLAQATPGAPFPLAGKLERTLRVHGSALPSRAARDARGARSASRIDPASPRRWRRSARSPQRRPPTPSRCAPSACTSPVARGDFAAAARELRAGLRPLPATPPTRTTPGARSTASIPPRARSWFGRIPARERSRFPRLALYEAERALARKGRRCGELAAHRDALLRYRNTEEGREFPLVNGVLERLSHALGEEDAAGDFAAAARRAPGGPGARALALARAAALRGDAAGLDSALRELRFWAPSLRAAIGAENRFRSDHGLPLLPELPLERLGAPAA